MNPGWGDSVQANKAGLLEIADVFVVNKADRPGAGDTVRDLEQMLALSSTAGWTPPIIETVATEGTGVDKVWSSIADHRSHTQRDGESTRRRTVRVEAELTQIVAARLAEQAAATRADPRFGDAVADVVAREIDPWAAADRLIGV